MSETPEVAGSLAESFPPELAATLNRLADAYSIPRESMTPITIALIAAFSPTAYTTGIGGQVQPLIFHVKNVGNSGINKTGATKLVKYTFQKVRSALINLAGNPTTCFENGVRVNRRLVPDPDNTSSLPALVQKSVSCPNLFGNHDEHGGFTRQVTTGTPSPESGLQFHLETYNGPESYINELKNKTETTYFPRYSFLTSVQPHLVQKEYAPGTAYFDLGVASRGLWFELHPNFDEDRVRPPLNEDRQTLVEVVCAAAARSCITNGQWVLRLDSEEVEEKFVGKGKKPLNEFEQARLLFHQNRFEADGFGPLLAEQQDQVALVLKLNKQAEFERNKAAKNGEEVAGRYEENFEYQPTDQGEGPQLSRAMLEAGIDNIRVSQFVPGSEATLSMERKVVQLNKALSQSEAGSTRKNLLGKGSAQLLRLAGVMQVLQTAENDVSKLLGDKSLRSTSDMVAFMLQVKELEKKEAEAIPNEVFAFGTGTEYESRLPLHSQRAVDEVSVQRAWLVLQQSQQTARKLFEGQSTRAPCSSPSTESITAATAATPRDATTKVPALPIGQEARFKALVSSICKTTFQFAPLLSVLPSFRTRSSSRGDNQGPSELSLLAVIQDCGLVAVVVGGTPMNKKFFLRKLPVSGLSVNQKTALCKVLLKFNVTMDEFSAHAKAGKSDVSMLTAGEAYTGSVLPHGLVHSDTPKLFVPAEPASSSPPTCAEGSEAQEVEIAGNLSFGTEFADDGDLALGLGTDAAFPQLSSSNQQRRMTKPVVLPVLTQQRTADEDEESRGTDISNQENEGRAVSNSSCAAASASTRNGGLQSKAVHGRDAAQKDGNKAPGHNAGRRSETVLATTSHSGPVGHNAGRRSETVRATTSHSGPVSTQRRTYEESQASTSTDDVGDLGDMDDDDCDDNDESDQKQKRQKDGFK